MTERHGEHGGGDGGDGGEHEPHGEGEHEEDEAHGGPVATIAGGVGEVLGGIAGALGEGEDTEDARKGLETAAAVAEGVKKGAEAVEGIGSAIGQIQRGNAGGAAGSIGGALGNAGAGIGGLTSAFGGLLPEGEARRGLEDASRVANTVGQVARGLGQIVEGFGGLVDELGGGRTEVELHLEVEGEDVEWVVHSVHYEDAIGRLGECVIEARCPADKHVDEEGLLAKNVHLRIERGDEQRSFRGVVQHARVSPGDETTSVRIDVVPALWLLTQTLDSRVYQDLSVPDLVEQVVTQHLGSRHRTVRRELTETYAPHEYLVQYRESHYELIARLCQEEGIFFYFDHDEGEHEILVLADSNDNRPRVRDEHDGRIDYEQNENRRAGREVAYGVDRRRRVGPTDAVVRGFDWTNPSLEVQHARNDRGEWSGPPLEVYDHHHAVRHHEYDEGGGQYRSHTADRRSRLHTERLDVRRQSWTVHTTVVTAKPGHTFELVGTDDHDERYLILSVTGDVTASDHGGELDNTLEVIPASMPYRPPAPARRTMPGPETAIVVGPPGEEIHTDQHGRVKVQFHWDRQGQRDERSSTWLRVSQAWAGPGYGSIFIPRIGMEVIVSFLGGDPDRPIVTGCVYNGQNKPPYQLPAEKTKSTIKTNSSLGGGGFNELRFEDKAGSEQVYIHAQKNFDEVVENNHTTHVKNCQTNTVDVDQKETVGQDQVMNVKRNRTKTIEGFEINTVMKDRHEVVNQSEYLNIDIDRNHVVSNDESLTVERGTRTVTVQTGKDTETYNGGRETTVLAFDNLYVNEGANKNTQVTGQYNIRTDGHFAVAQGPGYSEKLVINNKGWWESLHQIKLIVATKAAVLKMFSSGKIELGADTEILIHVNKTSYLKLTASEIELVGPTIKINASAGTTEIDAASQVKIKC